MTKPLSSQWLFCRQRQSDARYVLVCFPPAGSGSGVFFPWSNEFSSDVEVHAVQLPGRERRLSEPLLTNFDQLIPPLTQALVHVADRPLILFGHSMGAIIAFEVLRSLLKLNADSPRIQHLFVAGRQAPHVRAQPFPVLPDDEFIRLLEGTYGVLPAPIRNDPELLRFFLPIIRSDMAMLGTYRFVESAPFEFPITALGGEQDPTAPVPLLEEWARHTQAMFTLKMFSGGHFFPQTQRPEVIQAIKDQLQLD